MEKPPHNWEAYREATKDREPAPLLVRALKYVHDHECALDLGAGALVDTYFLIEQGFKTVVALDQQPCPNLTDPRIIYEHSSFEEYPFPEGKFDLVNAQFSLPFCGSEHFDDVWSDIKDSLKIGGVFSGQLFGINDEWYATHSHMTFHTQEEVLKLFEGFKVHIHNERDEDGKLASGEAKHWHVHHMVAEKVD